MDLFEAIEADHEKLRGLFRELKDPMARDQARTLRELDFALLEHQKAEEAVLYPVLEDADDTDAMLEALEEHHALRLLLANIQRENVSADRFRAKVTVISDLFEHHVEEEEDVIFAQAREFIDDDVADRLGEDFEAAKEEAQTVAGG